MRTRLPSLNALRFFESAARLGSFKAAAGELCVSRSAVSHQVKTLEHQLGVELFLRNNSAVELTRVGRAYYPILRDAFDRISEGTELAVSLGRHRGGNDRSVMIVLDSDERVASTSSIFPKKPGWRNRCVDY